MNAAPGANDEYSRGSRGPAGDSGPSGGGRPPREGRRRGAFLPLPGGAAALALGGALLGALLLIVAEFTTLYQVHVQGVTSPIRSAGTGANHAYAMIPIALVAAFLAWAARRGGGRVALVGIGVLGVVALLIALVGDLPDAHSSGVLGSAGTHYAQARSSASAGLYMETLGAVVLVATCGSTLLLAAFGRVEGDFG